jgi:hypothetical protein
VSAYGTKNHRSRTFGACGRPILEAHRLLYDKSLVDLNESVGPTRVFGSFSLDLMTCPDVDISLELPNEKDISTFFAIG